MKKLKPKFFVPITLSTLSLLLLLNKFDIFMIFIRIFFKTRVRNINNI